MPPRLASRPLPRRSVIIGNSVGGYSAVRLALECPERVRSLVLMAPGGFTEPTAVTRLSRRSD